MNIVKITDGLGNQMFQYAFARNLQIQCKKRVCIDYRFINHEDLIFQGGQNTFYKKCDTRKYRLDYFKITLPQAEDSDLLKWKFLKQENHIEKVMYCLAQNSLWPWQYRNEEKIKAGTLFDMKKYCFSTYFEGYFFDLRYYDDIRPILQREFCVKRPIPLSNELKRVLETRETVGVHVRKGDFTKLSRDISQKGYYKNAIKELQKYVKEPVYLLFSDDIEWVRDNLDIDGKKIYVSSLGLQDYEEFTIMKHCKHNIIANSTFSYWAAYLNNHQDKVVICPKRWRTNTIPEDWISV